MRHPMGEMGRRMGAREVITDDTLVALAEEIEELRASRALLYDALAHVRNIAKQGVIPGADMPEALRKIADKALRVKQLCDGLMVAGHVKGMEIADEEIVALAKAAGGMSFLSPEGQMQWIGARKREAKRNGHAEAQARDGTRDGEGTGVVRSLTLIGPSDPQRS